MAFVPNILLDDYTIVELKDFNNDEMKAIGVQVYGETYISLEDKIRVRYDRYTGEPEYSPYFDKSASTPNPKRLIPSNPFYSTDDKDKLLVATDIQKWGEKEILPSVYMWRKYIHVSDVIKNTFKAIGAKKIHKKEGYILTDEDEYGRGCIGFDKDRTKAREAITHCSFPGSYGRIRTFIKL